MLLYVLVLLFLAVETSVAVQDAWLSTTHHDDTKEFTEADQIDPTSPVKQKDKISTGDDNELSSRDEQLLKELIEVVNSPMKGGNVLKNPVHDMQKSKPRQNTHIESSDKLEAKEKLEDSFLTSNTKGGSHNPAESNNEFNLKENAMAEGDINSNDNEGPTADSTFDANSDSANEDPTISVTKGVGDSVYGKSRATSKYGQPSLTKLVDETSSDPTSDYLNPIEQPTSDNELSFQTSPIDTTGITDDISTSELKESENGDQDPELGTSEYESDLLPRPDEAEEEDNVDDNEEDNEEANVGDGVDSNDEKSNDNSRVDSNDNKSNEDKSTNSKDADLLVQELRKRKLRDYLIKRLQAKYAKLGIAYDPSERVGSRHGRHHKSQKYSNYE